MHAVSSYRSNRPTDKQTHPQTHTNTHRIDYNALYCKVATWATSVLILVSVGSLRSRVRPNVRNRRTSYRETDVRRQTKHRLMHPSYGGGCIINFDFDYLLHKHHQQNTVTVRYKFWIKIRPLLNGMRLGLLTGQLRELKTILYIIEKNCKVR